MNNVNGGKNIESIKIICEEFEVKNATIISKQEKSYEVEIMKSFSEDYKYTKFIQEFGHLFDLENHESEDFLVFLNNITETNKLMNQLKRFQSVIVVSNQMKEQLRMTNVNFNLDKRVYFYDTISNDLFEAYAVNGKKISRKLGKVIQNKFIWDPNSNSNFEKRRSNFQGIHLTAMTEREGTDLILDEEYSKKAPFFKSNQTYLVNDFMNGLYHDILLELQMQLNFSTSVFKRKVESWGFVYEEPNSTFRVTGMVGDLFSKKVDLVIAPLTMIIERAIYVDFMPPLTPYELGLFIPDIGSKEEFDLDIFINPMRADLWFGLLTLILILSTIKLFISYFHYKVSLDDIFTLVWSTFAAFWGSKPFAHKIDPIPSYKMTIFTSLLCGTIIWIAYRSSLTSELSIVIDTYPFSDLESFSNTEWKYVCLEVYLNNYTK